MTDPHDRIDFVLQRALKDAQEAGMGFLTVNPDGVIHHASPEYMAGWLKRREQDRTGT